MFVLNRKLVTAAAILGVGIALFAVLKMSGSTQQPVESRERVWRVDTLTAYASEQDQHGAAKQGMVVNASLQNRCATCQYWGGTPRIPPIKA